MFVELLVALGAVTLMQSGHTPRSAARTIGRVAGRAAGSVRRARAEVVRMQQRAQAAGGADLHNSSAELAQKLQQLRMVQQETSSILRMRPSTLFTADGRTVEQGTSEFSDEELYDALKGEVTGGGVHAAGLNRAPPLAAGGSTGEALYEHAVRASSAVHTTPLGSSAGLHPAPTPAAGFGSTGGAGQPLRGAAMMADLLRWETRALEGELARGGGDTPRRPGGVPNRDGGR